MTDDANLVDAAPDAADLPPEAPPAAPPVSSLPPRIPTVDMPPAVPKARSVLMDILDRAKTETESETANLMASLKEREEADRRAREADEQRRAAEARVRVEEEKRKREEALREYEQRKARVEEEKRKPVQRVAEISIQAAPPPSNAGRWMGIAAAVIVVGGAAAWFLVPRGDMAVFGLDKAVETAKPGTMQSTAVPVGPKTLTWEGNALPPERVVAMAAPGRYEVSAPRPANGGRRPAVVKKEDPLVKIETGSLFGTGKKKVVK